MKMTGVVSLTAESLWLNSSPDIPSSWISSTRQSNLGRFVSARKASAEGYVIAWRLDARSSRLIDRQRLSSSSMTAIYTFRVPYMEYRIATGKLGCLLPFREGIEGEDTRIGK
jgi:hypothetical protein